ERLDDEVAQPSGTQCAGEANESDHAFEKDQGRCPRQRSRVAEAVGEPEPLERISDEGPTTGALQGLPRVISGQPPRLRNLIRRAHRPSSRGTRTVIAPGSTLHFSRLVFFRTPPSISEGTPLSNRVSNVRPSVASTKGDPLGAADHRPAQRSDPVHR